MFGAITGFVNIGADKYYFRQLIPELGDLTPETSLIGMLAGIFYGGIFEEVLMRLLVMSLLVWVFHKIFTRKKENIQDGIIGFLLSLPQVCLPQDIYLQQLCFSVN